MLVCFNTELTFHSINNDSSSATDLIVVTNSIINAILFVPRAAFFWSILIGFEKKVISLSRNKFVHINP